MSQPLFAVVTKNSQNSQAQHYYQNLHHQPAGPTRLKLSLTAEPAPTYKMLVQMFPAATSPLEEKKLSRRN